MLIIVDIYKTYCKLHAKLCKHCICSKKKNPPGQIYENKAQVNSSFNPAISISL